MIWNFIPKYFALYRNMISEEMFSKKICCTRRIVWRHPDFRLTAEGGNEESKNSLLLLQSQFPGLEAPIHASMRTKRKLSWIHFRRNQNFFVFLFFLYFCFCLASLSFTIFSHSASVLPKKLSSLKIGFFHLRHLLLLQNVARPLFHFSVSLSANFFIFRFVVVELAKYPIAIICVSLFKKEENIFFKTFSEKFLQMFWFSQ